MTLALFIKYLHIIFIFLLVSSVAIEFVLIKKRVSRQVISQLAKADLIYGISSIVVVALGFVLWLGLGKPADFYSDNPIFWIKIALAVLLGLLSIYPTVFFIKNRKGKQDDSVELNKWIFYSIYAELGVLTLIPLLAVLMANGVGL